MTTRQRHACGDPDCDGEALACLMRTCAHDRRREFFGIHGYAVWLGGDDKRDVRQIYWCPDCGALGVPKDEYSRDDKLEWRPPNWSSFVDGFRG
jgi:hypothetical protein